MATTEEYKNGGNASYSFSIEYIKAEDIKVTVDGTSLTYTATNPPAQTTEYTVNGSNVIFKQASVSGSTNGGVRIYRETDLGNSDSVTFQPGSSIRAADLNANHKLVRFSAQEKNQEIVTADIRNNAITTSKIADNAVDTAQLANGAVDTQQLKANSINSDKIADDQINSEHYVDGSIDEQHLSNSAVTQNKLANNSVGTPELINGSVNSDKILDGTIVNADISSSAAIDASKIVSATGSVAGTMSASDKAKLDGIESGAKDDQTAAEIKTLLQSNKITDSEIATGTLDNRYFTETELTNGALDGRYFTETESDARYFNVSTGDTVKDGDTFPDNDTTIATTAAINDRIIDLVDDVGGFVPIANETSFPTSNPDVNDGAGTIVSVSAASTNLVPSGTTVTIANGRGSGLAVIITGVPSTIPSGFGFLVETTTTDHTYAFHRLSPKATEVTTVAGKATEVTTVHTNINNVNTVATNISDINAVAADATDIGAVAAKATEISRLGTADAVADMAILGTADVVADLNTLGTADVVADMNMLATSDVVADMNMLAVSDVISDMNDLATSGNITAMDTCSTNISSINNASANISSVNTFGDQYQVAANNPSTDGGGNALAAGDLYFNTSANELKVYNGSSWQGGVTAAGSFAATTGNTFTGDNRYNDGVKALFGTGSDLEIFHDGSNSYIQDAGTGSLYIKSSAQLYLQSYGGETFFKADANGAAELYYDNSKKFETTSTGATVTGTVTATSFAGDGSSLTGIDTDLVADTSPQLGGDLSTNGNNINFGDSSGTGDDRATFGAAGDLQIYHDGSDSYILENGTGGLNIKTNGTAIDLTKTPHENLARFIVDGAVELYYDNSKKLETQSWGVNISGNALIDGSCIPYSNNNSDLGLSSSRWKDLYLSNDIDIIDNGKLLLGTGNDLQIYHTGSHSYIKDAGTGNLIVSSSQMQIINAAENEMMARFDQDGAVELYYDGSKKFETKSYGALVTGYITASPTSGNLGFHAGDNTKMTFGAGDDLQIYHDGSNSHIQEVGTGSLLIKSDAVNLGSASGEYYFRGFENGAVQLRYDNSTKFETTSAGVSVSGNLVCGTVTLSGGGLALADNDKVVCGNGDDLQIYHDGSSSFLKNTSNGNLFIQDDVGQNIYIRATPNENAAVFKPNGAVELFYNNSKKFETATNGGIFRGTTWTAVDNCKIAFGSGDDLQIYHDGSNSYIKDTGTGVLVVNTNQLHINNAANNENIIKGTENGSVELYYDNSKKFETTSVGTQVTGVIETVSTPSSDPYSGFIARSSGANNHVGFFADASTGANAQAHYRFGYSGSPKWQWRVPFHQDGASAGMWLYEYTNGQDVLKIDTSGNQSIRGHVYPRNNNTYDLGTSNDRWRNVYTNDLHLSNEGSSNDVDGTWGDWTIQEGESDLFLKNNRSGKKYKFNLTEVS